MQIELAAGERKGVGVEVGEVSGGLQLDFAIVRSSHGGDNAMFVFEWVGCGRRRK